MLARRELFERKRDVERVFGLGAEERHGIREVAAMMGNWFREEERKDDARWREAPTESRVEDMMTSGRRRYANGLVLDRDGGLLYVRVARRPWVRLKHSGFIVQALSRPKTCQEIGNRETVARPKVSCATTATTT